MAKRQDVGDETQVKERQRQVLSKTERQVIELGNILNSYPMRKYIWDKIAACGVFDSSFTGEAETTFFREGKRAIGLLMLTEILTHYPKQFTLMQSEAIQRSKEEND